jgi:hypothetical protein
MSNSQSGHEAVNTELEGPVTLEAITRQLVKTQHPEKTLHVL